MNSKLKSILASAVAVTLSLSALSASASVFAQVDTTTESTSENELVTFESDGLTYTIIDKSNVSVSGLAAYAVSVDIPETVIYGETEYNIVEIGERAFERKGVRNITLPSTLKAIGDMAFYYSSIQEIDIPESVVTIGTAAFGYCGNLITITLPNGVTSVGDRAFTSCTKLTSASIPASVESLGKNVFYSCSSLKTIAYGSTEADWTLLSAESEIADTVNIICNCSDAELYNTSELVLGQKLNEGDKLHYDDVNGIGSVANIVTTSGSYELAFINEINYILPFNAEVVGIDGLTIYLAPEYDDISYVDLRTLNVGDTIASDTYLLCYDYVVNNCVLPVFMPSYYEKYVGKGTVRLKSIDNDTKKAELEVFVNSDISGDTNNDADVTVADVVVLQKYVLNSDEKTLFSEVNADLNSDSKVDVFDLIALRKQLLKTINVANEQ